MSRSVIIRCGLALGAAAPLATADVYWHGYGHQDNWGNPFAWDQNAVPGNADTALLTYGINLLAVPDETHVGSLILDTYVSWGPPGEIQMQGNTLTVLDGGEWQWGGFSDYYHRSGTVNLFGTMVLVDDINDHLGNGDVTVDPVHHSVHWGVTLNNYGTMRLQGMGTLGVENMLNAGTFEFKGDGDITDIGHGGERLTNEGDIIKESGSGFSYINPELDNAMGEVEARAGTLQIQTPLDIAGTTLTGGHWLVSNGAILELIALQPTETNEGSITLHGAASNMIVGLHPIENTLLTNHAHLKVIGDRTFANDLHNTLRFWIGAGSTVTTNITNDGWVGVTNSPGLVVIDGDVTIGSTGKFDVKLGGTTPVTEHDVIEVNGTVAADNTIIVRDLPGFRLEDHPVGTSWTVVRATDITGTFDRAVYIDGPDSFLDVVHEYGTDGRDTVSVVYVRNPCGPADIAEPPGVLDLSDINVFVNGFLAQEPIADLAEPFGVFDLSDVNTFVSSFVAGCP